MVKSTAPSELAMGLLNNSLKGRNYERLILTSETELSVHLWPDPTKKNSVVKLLYAICSDIELFSTNSNSQNQRNFTRQILLIRSDSKSVKAS